MTLATATHFAVDEVWSSAFSSCVPRQPARLSSGSRAKIEMRAVVARRLPDSGLPHQRLCNCPALCDLHLGAGLTDVNELVELIDEFSLRRFRLFWTSAEIAALAGFKAGRNRRRAIADRLVFFIRSHGYFLHIR